MKEFFCLVAAAMFLVTFSACKQAEKTEAPNQQEEMSKTESGEKPIFFEEDPEQKQSEGIVILEQEQEEFIPKQEQEEFVPKQEQKQSQKQKPSQKQPLQK